MITLRNITKSFDSHPVLSGLSLDVAAGETVCLLGPSGCGKTTLLNILAGLEHPDTGTVHIDGAHIGFLFQNRDLLPWCTVLDNAALGLEFQRMEKSAARKIAQGYLNELCLSKAGGLYPSQISGGMKQRAALAQVLASRPDVLLLDEPLNGLDINTRRIVSAVIKKTIRDRKISAIIVTHSIEEAIFLADRLIILTTGPAVIAADIPMAGQGPDAFDHILSAFIHANPGDCHARAA
jgi:ABC-type nitrate/sulfonate/bicarbonate transport system ATPase subunit